MPRNPVLDFTVDRDAIRFVGHDLQRPECILAEPDGRLWVADARGGVVDIAPDGQQRIVTQQRSDAFAGADSEADRYLRGTLPNGLAFARGGEFLIANFGTDCLEIMSRDGRSRVLADTIDGAPIGKVNFVLRDSRDRIFITVSTRVKNWMHALRTDLADGYVALYDRGVVRMIADRFGFTNEIRFDAAEEYLYVVETTGGRITRLRLDEAGEVRQRETFGPDRLGTGAWPDGIAFDRAGNLWGTHVYSDRLWVMTPDGDFRVLLDEGDPAAVEALERAFFANRVTEDVLFATGRGLAPWMASVTFGGPDLQTLYLGSLKGSRLPYFRAPVAGLPMAHWAERR